MEALIVVLDEGRKDRWGAFKKYKSSDIIHAVWRHAAESGPKYKKLAIRLISRHTEIDLTKRNYKGWKQDSGIRGMDYEEWVGYQFDAVSFVPWAAAEKVGKLYSDNPLVSPGPPRMRAAYGMTAQQLMAG